MSDTMNEHHRDRITARFDGSRCIHLRTCVLSLPGVFVANAEGPWIRPDNAAVNAVVACCSQLPVGGHHL